MGQESRSKLAEGFWLRVPQEVTVKTSARAASSEGSTGVGGAASKLVPSHGCWPEASVPHHVDLAIGLLMTWQLASSRESVIDRYAVLPLQVGREGKSRWEHWLERARTPDDAGPCILH